MRNWLLVVVLVAMSWWPLGCGRDEEIRTYDAPKDAPAPRAVASMQMPPMPPGPAGEDRPSWTVPPGWKEVDSTQSMRLATFMVDEQVPEAQVTVIPLGSEAGPEKLLENINRWEGQIGLPPTPLEDLPKVTRSIDVNGVAVTYVELRGEEQRTLAAMFPRERRVWFFKLTGPQGTVEEHAGEFDEFIGSVKFDAAAPAAAAPAPAPGAGMPGMPGMPPGAEQMGAMAQPALKWKLPEGWIEDPTPRAMRYATLKTSAEAESAEIIITALGAEFGDMLSNINRWRGMVGLEAVGDVKEQPVETMEVAGNTAAKFDMTGPGGGGQPAQRMLITMVPAGNTVWFFRMIGPADEVGRNKAAFDEFVQSIQFP